MPATLRRRAFVGDIKGGALVTDLGRTGALNNAFFSEGFHGVIPAVAIDWWTAFYPGRNSLGYADGAAVSTWRDDVPNMRRTASQATGTKQPRFRSAAATVNSQPALDFDGGDALELTPYTQQGPCTLAAVVYLDPAQSAAGFLVSGYDGMIRCRADGSFEVYCWGSSTATQLGTTDRRGTLCYVEAYINGASSTWRVNATTGTAPLMAGGNTFTTRLAIGSWDGNASAGDTVIAKYGFAGIYRGKLSDHPAYTAWLAWITSTFGIGTGGAITLPVTPATVALAPQAGGVSLSAIDRPITPVTGLLVPQASGLSLGAVSLPVTPDPIAVVARTQSLSVGAVSLPLTQAQVQLVAEASGISSSGGPLSPAVTPATVQLVAQGAGRTLGAVSVAVTPPSIQTVARTQALSLGSVSVGQTPVALTASGVAVGRSLGAVNLAITPRSVAATPVANALSVGTASPAVTPTSIAVVARTQGLSVGAVSRAVTPGIITLSPQEVFVVVPGIDGLVIAVSNLTPHLDASHAYVPATPIPAIGPKDLQPGLHASPATPGLDAGPLHLEP